MAGAALAVRAAFLWFYRASPFFEAPILDSAFHDGLARAFAGGDLAAGAPYFRPPLFPWTLGTLYAVFGAGPWPGRLLGAAAGTLTAVAVLFLGGRVGLGRRARVLAGLAAALHAPALFLEGELLGEPLATALAAWGLVACADAWSAAAAEGPKRRGLVRWSLTGLLWGLAALARAPLALLLPLAGLLVLGSPGRRAAALASVAGPVILVWLGPALVMNAHEAGPRFPATQGGINFYAGNHRGADGRGVSVPDLAGIVGWPEFAGASVRAASAGAGRELDPAEASGYWYARGRAFWAGHPGEALALTARKTLYLLHGFETPNNRSVYEARRDVPWLHAVLWKLPGLYLPSGLLLPLALVGAWSVRRRRVWRPVLLYAGTTLLPLALFFVCARFRVPALPALAVLAVAGALSLGRSPRRWLALGALVLALNLPVAGAAGEDPPRDALARAEALYNAGRFEAAGDAYRRVLALDAAEPRAHLGLAVLAERRGDLEAATEHLEAAGGALEGYWAAEWTAARVLEARGRGEEALPHLRRAVAAHPEEPELWGSLGLALEVRGRDDEARAALEEAGERGSRSPEVWNSLGRYRMLAGDSAGAGDAWDRALALDPAHFKALYNRGLWRAQRRDGPGARADLESAEGAAPDSASAARAREARELIRNRLP